MNLRINWEALGIAASVACAIHCAVVPLLITSLPLFGVNLVHNMFIEILLLGSAFVIGFKTLWHGYKKHHHHWATLIPFSAGMILFTINQFVHFPYSSFVFVIPAATAVVSAHLLNHRLCKKTGHCHVKGCNHE